MNRRSFLASAVAGCALPLMPEVGNGEETTVYRRTSRNGKCLGEYTLLIKHREVLVINGWAGDEVEELIRQKDWPALKSPKYKHHVRVLRRSNPPDLIHIDEDIDPENARICLERLHLLFGRRTGLTTLIVGVTK